jgi:hypothetical protein
VYTRVDFKGDGFWKIMADQKVYIHKINMDDDGISLEKTKNSICTCILVRWKEG